MLGLFFAESLISLFALQLAESMHSIDVLDSLLAVLQ